MRKTFEEWEKDFIYLSYPEFSNIDIANILGRSEGVIKGFASSKKYKKQKLITIGQKFGKLLVISKSKNKRKDRQNRWNCICDCGKKTEVATGTLTSGHSSSCGCGRIEAISKSFGSISGVMYSQIKKNAKTRKKDFNLSIEYLDSLLKSQKFLCNLSGLKLEIKQGRASKETTASLDRIDSSKGYVEGNVQWVHKYVNWMKLDFTQEEFIELCSLIHRNQKNV